MKEIWMPIPSGEPSLAVAIVELLGDLAWPAAMLVVVRSFRPQISLLLARVATIKVAGSEFVFQAPSKESMESASAPVPAPDLAPDGFMSIEGVREAVASSGKLPDGDRLTGELLIFQTPSQRTWLLASSTRLLIVLDDAQTRARGAVVQEALSIDEVLPMQFGLHEGAGILRFASQKNWWFYSVALFGSSAKLESSIARLIQS